MSSETALKSVTDALAASAITRQPRQGRSRASFERMIAAAKELMLERGNDSFTLQEVSERGNVSIGSIYLRFESKDRLIHAVVAEELQAIAEDERQMIDGVVSASDDLAAFLDRYVHDYAEFLTTRAPLLRLIMDRASVDAAVSQPGKQTAAKAEELSVAAILRFANEITGADPERKARTAYHIIFATVARHLSLGSTEDSADAVVWSYLLDELSKVTLAYLTHGDCSRCGPGRF